MRRWQELTLLILIDTIASVVALFVAMWSRRVATLEAIVFPPLAYVIPFLILALGWVGLFAYIGLYDKSWSRKSRFDELIWVVKGIIFGGIVIFLITFDPERPFAFTRIVILNYGITLVVLSAFGRLVVRGVQRRLFGLGHGRRNAIIVGTGESARRLCETMKANPRLGYRIIGFVTTNNEHIGTHEIDDSCIDDSRNSETPESATPSESDDISRILGTFDELPEQIAEHHVTEVMFAEPTLSHDEVLDAVGRCNGLRVSFSTLPDLYDVVIGRSNLGQLYGTPLMPLFPSSMVVWQRRTKRVIEFIFALVTLIVGAPIWLIVASAIWLQDRHFVIYSQDRLGFEGREFRIHKFRSMIPDAEKHSGPTWATEDDPRITPIGKFIRKTRLDEVPQLWNVLRGEMSLVGPRPERRYFVDQLAKEIPLYRRRLLVKPGITGWAQTKGAYDVSVDDVREKLKYDLYYIENMSLRFDLLILARTIWVVVAGKGR